MLTSAPTENYGFPASNILLLTDDDRRTTRPTRKEMFQAMSWLVQGARRDDSLFFHYSGHGGQSKDASGREVDQMDESAFSFPSLIPVRKMNTDGIRAAIFPVDFKEAGDIIDDELYQALVQNLPTGCRLTAIFDVSPCSSSLGCWLSACRFTVVPLRNRPRLTVHRASTSNHASTVAI